MKDNGASRFIYLPSSCGVSLSGGETDLVIAHVKLSVVLAHENISKDDEGQLVGAYEPADADLIVAVDLGGHLLTQTRLQGYYYSAITTVKRWPNQQTRQEYIKTVETVIIKIYLKYY